MTEDGRVDWSAAADVRKVTEGKVGCSAAAEELNRAKVESSPGAGGCSLAGSILVRLLKKSAGCCTACGILAGE